MFLSAQLFLVSPSALAIFDTMARRSVERNLEKDLRKLLNDNLDMVGEALGVDVEHLKKADKADLIAAVVLGRNGWLVGCLSADMNNED